MTSPPTAPPADPRDKEYVLGTDDDELVRLGFQHQVWRAAAGALWDRAGLGPGQSILDVGSGPGWATLDLAHIVGGTGRVAAVDISPRFVAHLRALAAARGLAHVEVHEGDVQRLGLPEASFDGAYSRWVLCFVPEPEAVIAAVARTLKRGAFFAVQDYVHYGAAMVAPPSAIFEKVVAATRDSWAASGGDPRVGARLPQLMERHGLEVREVTPLQRTARPGTMLWHWPTTFFRNYLPHLVQEGRITAEDQRAWHADWAARGREPGSFFLTPPMVDILAVKR